MEPWKINGKVELCLAGRIHPVLSNGRYHPSVRKRINASKKRQQYLENKANRAIAQAKAR